MGWSGGSEMMSKIILLNDIHSTETFENSTKYYKKLISIFEDQDCDTLYECLGQHPSFDQAYAELYPDHYEELFTVEYDDDLLYENIDNG